MNSKRNSQKAKGQRELLTRELRTNIIQFSNPLYNIPVHPNPKSNKYELKKGLSKNYSNRNHNHNSKLCSKGFSFATRQYSSNYLQITPKPNKQSTKAMIDKREQVREKSLEILEQKYIDALNQVKKLKTDRASKANIRKDSKINTYVSKSPIRNQINMNTELLKKRTQQFINKRIPDRSPLRPKTPDYMHDERDHKPQQQKTPDSHLKRMSYYINTTITNNNLPTKSPSRNTKSKINGSIYQNTHINHNLLNTQTQNKTNEMSYYEYVSNNKENYLNGNQYQSKRITTTNTLKRDKHKSSYTNLTMNSSLSQKTFGMKQKKSTSSIHIQPENTHKDNHLNKNKGNQDSTYHNINIKTNNNGKDLIRLNKPNQSKESQSRKTIQSDYCLPDEEPIDFNELDQFSPPYVGSINFNLNTKDNKIISPVGSTIYTTIEMMNQDKQLSSGTIPASSSLHTSTINSDNKQIIDNFLSKITQCNSKYSTLDYNSNTNQLTHVNTTNQKKRELYDYYK